MTFQSIFTIATAIVNRMHHEHDSLSQAITAHDDSAPANAIRALAEAQHLDAEVLYDLSCILSAHDSIRIWEGGRKWEQVSDSQGNVILSEERLRDIYYKQLEGNARYAERRKAQGR